MKDKVEGEGSGTGLIQNNGENSGIGMVDKLKKLGVDINLFDDWLNQLIMLGQMFGVSIINELSWHDDFEKGSTHSDAFFSYTRLS
ncbi:MAG: hypothetical protein QM478_11505 [Flavobacteriaceae bacterium]